MLQPSFRIIELYGKPGVGKSTLARQFVQEGGYYHVTATAVSRLEYVKLSIVYPRAVLFWLGLITRNLISNRSFRRFRYNISLLFTSLKKMYVAKQSKEGRVVIDEGLVQRFLSNSDVILSERTITRLLAVSPLGDCIILCNDREVLKDRYDEAHDRGSGGEETLRVWRENMTKNIATIDTILNKLSRRHFTTKEVSFDDILSKISTT